MLKQKPYRNVVFVMPSQVEEQMLKTQLKVGNVNATEDPWKSVKIPLMHFKIRTSGSFPTLKFLINANLLAIVLYEEKNQMGVFYTLGNLLYSIRYSDIWFLIQDDVPNSNRKWYLTKLFNNCWSMKSINVLASFKDAETLYTYTPFPTYEVQEKPILELEKNLFFENKMKDIKGYPVRISFYNGPPRSLQFTDRNGKIQYGGYLGHLLTSLTERINGKFDVVYGPSQVASPTVAKQLMYEDKVDFCTSVTGFPGLNQNKTDTIDYINLVVAVPLAKEIKQYEYILRPFDTWTWIAIIFGIFYLSGALCLIQHVFYQKSDYWNAFTNCLRAILFQSFVMLNKFNWNISWLYIVLMLFGFIVSTIFLAFLGSFLTTTLIGEQINTMSDIINSNLKIMMMEDEYDLLFKQQIRPIPNIYRKILKRVTYNTLIKHRENLNTSFGYIIPADKWFYNLLQAQNLHNFFTFQIISLYMIEYNIQLNLAIDANTIFKTSINQHMFDVVQTGLFNKWTRDSIYEVMQAGGLMELDMPEDSKTKPLQVLHLYYLWIGLVIGYVISILCFLCEILLHRWRANQK